MQVARTVDSVRTMVRAARESGKRIGLVPTMGALHTGHISLIEAARQECDFVVVSIFVNPTQFGVGEDFEEYPRVFDADVQICRSAGVDVVFAPTAEEMYGGESVTWVDVDKLTEGLCGKFRPGHFRGVTTVCAKLFNIVLPDAAYFGQKDGQQSVVIRRMVVDLKMPLRIVVCPTVREADGLAVSSRNKYLSEQQRKDAASIYRSLAKCRDMIEGGVSDREQIISEMRKILEQVGPMEIEYVSLVDAETLEVVERVQGRIMAAVAVRLGAGRLIDNIVMEVP